MVEAHRGSSDSSNVPTIASLLTLYRDRTGASYDDMSRTINGAISGGRLHQLATQTPRNFPGPDTIQCLADLLQMSVTTVLEAFAVSLGLQVNDRSLLALTLPPGTDNLTDRDRAAVLAIIRQLVEARREATPPLPDLSRVQGLQFDEEPPEPQPSRSARDLSP